MTFFTDLTARVRSLLHHDREERELDEELRFHLERDIAERVRQGASAGDARRAAQRALGNIELRKEEVRDAGGLQPLRELGSDVRYALRGLRRSPSFTLTGVVVLALGLGATTAVYSVLDSVVLSPLPYPDADRLVRVAEQGANGPFALSVADVNAIRSEQRSFTAWGAAERREVALAGTGEPERIVVARVEAGFMAASGIPVAVGRSIESGDEAQGAPDVMVIAHALAERRLGGASRAVGQSLTIDGIPHTVVGVLPPGRADLNGLRASAWPALKFRTPTRRGPFFLRGIGRLKPGVTIDAAAKDLASISVRLRPVWGDFSDSTVRFTPMALRESIIGKADRQVYLFAGAVLLLLLLAITNVTTLALVRATARASEMSVRVMLGARRRRLARLLVTESLVLTGAAGFGGLALALGGVKLAKVQLSELPRIQESALDWRAATVCLVAATVSGILVSLSPLAALVARNARLQAADGRRAGTARHTNRMRATLVTTQFALALPLLVGAGLLLNSFGRLQRVQPGFETAGLVALGVNLPAATYPDSPEVDRFTRLVEQRLHERFGPAIGLVSQIPPDNSGDNDNFNLVRHPVPQGQSEPTSSWYYVTPTYHEALGMRLLSGRAFTVGDSGPAPPVVIVSQSWARRYLPREDPVGQQLVQGGCYNCPRTTIVGVVSDIRNLGPAREMEAVYGPLPQSNTRSMFLVARSPGGSAEALRVMRDEVRALDPQLPVEETTIAGRYDDMLGDPRRWAALLGAFAAAGVLLSALGVFGLMSYVVRQRRREIGVRLALGAQQAEITRSVVARGMRYAVIGSAIGLLLALQFAGHLQALLFDVSATDPRTIAAVALVLLLAGLLAAWIPGYRAARIRPIEAIGSE